MVSLIMIVRSNGLQSKPKKKKMGIYTSKSKKVNLSHSRISKILSTLKRNLVFRK